MLIPTFRGCACGVTTVKPRAMEVALGVGAKKVSYWGKRPRGESSSRTREIRQGGVGA